MDFPDLPLIVMVIFTVFMVFWCIALFLMPIFIWNINTRLKELKTSIDEIVRPQGARPCPHCRSLIRSDAVVCRFCGRLVSSGDPPRPMSTE